MAFLAGSGEDKPHQPVGIAAFDRVVEVFSGLREVEIDYRAVDCRIDYAGKITVGDCAGLIEVEEVVVDGGW